jgi:hypothetical protein
MRRQYIEAMTGIVRPLLSPGKRNRSGAIGNRKRHNDMGEKASAMRCSGWSCAVGMILFVSKTSFVTAAAMAGRSRLVCSSRFF